MRLLYNRLDWIIPIYIDEYVSLTGQQEDFFNPLIDRVLGWHRAEELPRYIQLLDALKSAQKQPMSRDQVLDFFAEAEGLWGDLLQRILPALGELTSTLQEGQIQEVDDGLQKKIRKLQRKYGQKNQTERRAMIAGKVSDTMQDLLGEVTEQQAELISAWSRTKNDTTKDWLAFRDTWRRTFIELLQHRQGVYYPDQLRLFLLQPEKLYSAAHEQAIRENRRLLAQLIADLSATLAPDQQNHLQQKLSEIIADLYSLHNQAK